MYGPRVASPHPVNLDVAENEIIHDLDPVVVHVKLTAQARDQQPLVEHIGPWPDLREVTGVARQKHDYKDEKRKHSG